MTYLVNFIIIFLFTQSIGGLMATAALGTFPTIREKFHSNVLVEKILLTDPGVAQRVSQLSATYGKVITDKALLNAEGLALLSRQVSREAYMLAYGDTFFVIALVSAVSPVILLVHFGLRWLMARSGVRTAWSRYSLKPPGYGHVENSALSHRHHHASRRGSASPLRMASPALSTSVETTDNAYVRGLVTMMSPQISGYVVEVPVKDYQAVNFTKIAQRVSALVYASRSTLTSP